VRREMLIFSAIRAISSRLSGACHLEQHTPQRRQGMASQGLRPPQLGSYCNCTPSMVCNSTERKLAPQLLKNYIFRRAANTFPGESAEKALFSPLSPNLGGIFNLGYTPRPPAGCVLHLFFRDLVTQPIWLE
jgi:hypothetical protein